ncbi:MAG: dephospho-CoA kinase [Thermoguttaceae bacterium]|jgi:dephospho-CoA kinase
MYILGLLGGVASGKSLVAGQLARLGAIVLDADRVGHEVLRLPPVEAAARRRWGEGVFGPDGHVDRARLARLVFAPAPAGPPERRFLEELTHPEIGRRLARERAALGPEVPLAVLDAALILEAGWDKLCEKLLFVDVPREVRLCRARARGWNEQDFAAREDAQESLDLKRRRADVVIDNSGSPDHTQLQIDRLWQSLVG